jgi:hypothetical protein
MTFLWKIFTPFEVKVVINEVKNFFSNNTSSMFMASENAMEISKEAISFFKANPSKVMHAIRIDNIPPAQIALNLIYIIVKNKLSSGRYHRYRGLLSDAGNNLRLLHSTCLDELNKMGFFSEKDVEDEKAWINKEIKELG